MMLFVWFIFIVACLLFVGFSDYAMFKKDYIKQQNHDEQTKNFQKLYKSWSHK